MGNRMVRVERVPLGVGEHYVRGEFPDLVSQPLYRLFVHPQGVVAEIPALETDPDHPGGLLSLLVPDPLHVLDCLVRLVPKVPGLAALAVRERHHPRLPTSRDRARNRARGPPHEVARMGPHDQQLPAAATGLTHLHIPSLWSVPRAPCASFARDSALM